MGVARASAAAGMLDGKINVFGGCEDPNSDKWVEIFDPKTQTWDVLPVPLGPDEDRASYNMMLNSVVLDLEEKAMGGLYIWFKGKFDFNDTLGETRGWYLIDNVVYCFTTGGKVMWFALERRETEIKAIQWTEVMGLESLRDTLSASKLVNYSEWVGDLWEDATRERARLGLPTNQVDDAFPGLKLSSSGSNMLLFWGVLAPECLEIWCAEISLERSKERAEIRGNIEWSQAVMTLDPPLNQDHCKILYSLPINL
ncbi:putative F-box/kelch-repeat protein [Cardamine amara subsp. amara]|uniref:F-box/kelch-repeat protein n=1 Tax=Cardamine amara subsp. amara TaxID=228776 RepID=A0ABD1BSF8_CARAN